MLMAILTEEGGCDLTIACGTRVCMQTDHESKEKFISSIKKCIKNYDSNIKVEFFEVKKVNL